MYYILQKTINSRDFEEEMAQLGVKKKDYSYCVLDQGKRTNYDFYQLCFAICKSESPFGFDSASLSIYRINSDAASFYVAKSTNEIKILAKVEANDFINERQAFLIHQLNKLTSSARSFENTEKIQKMSELREELLDSVFAG